MHTLESEYRRLRAEQNDAMEALIANANDETQAAFMELLAATRAAFRAWKAAGFP